MSTSTEPSLITKQGYAKYEEALNSAVQTMQMQSPESYEKAQLIGENVASCEYDLKFGQDCKGQQIQATIIKDTIDNYGFVLEDFTKEEQELYNKFYVKTDYIEEKSDN